MAYEEIIKKASDTYGVDENLIKAVIKIESGGDPNATNKDSGAKGLMQLRDATAKEMGVSNSYDPEENIMGGTKYLRWLSDYFKKKGIRDEDLTTYVLAGYNWGIGHVQNQGLVNAPTETRNYIQNVLSYYKESGSSISSGHIIGTTVNNDMLGNDEDDTLKWWGKILVFLIVIVLGVFTVLFTMGALNDTGAGGKLNGLVKKVIKK